MYVQRSTSTSCSCLDCVNVSNEIKMITLPYSVEGLEMNRYFPIEIGEIYDPSKMWIVFLNKKLILWKQHLNKSYKRQRTIIPSGKLKLNLLCIAGHFNTFERAIILHKLIDNQVRIFMPDKGIFRNVKNHEIFYINEDDTTQPRFAHRAALENVAPARK